MNLETVRDRVLAEIERIQQDAEQRYVASAESIWHCLTAGQIIESLTQAGTATHEGGRIAACISLHCKVFALFGELVKENEVDS